MNENSTRNTCQFGKFIIPDSTPSEYIGDEWLFLVRRESVDYSKDQIGRGEWGGDSLLR